MRNRVLKAATLAVALGFIVFAAVAAGGGKKKNAQPVKPKPVVAADAGAASDAGHHVFEDLTGPRYLPASKAPGGMFLDVRQGAGGLGLGTSGDLGKIGRKPGKKAPQQQAPQQAPQQQAPEPPQP